MELRPDSALMRCDIFTHAPAHKVLQISYCTHLSSEHVLQTLAGMGMGMSVTVQLSVYDTLEQTNTSGTMPTDRPSVLSRSHSTRTCERAQ